MIYKEQIFVSAVVYVRNRQNHIENFLNSLAAFLEERFEHSEIICVNDASSDSSPDKIRAMKNSDTGVSISMITLSNFHGREAAMQCGINLSVGDFVLEFDNPVSDVNVENIFRVYQKALEGYDIVAATSRISSRRTSSLFYKIFNKSSDLAYDLQTELFRILSRRAINRVKSQNKIVPYRKVAYAASGLKYTSIEIETSMTPGKMEPHEKMYRSQLAVDSILMFTNVGFKCSVFMTALMMILMIAIAIYAIVSRIVINTMPGWASTVLIVAFGFFGLFLILSIIMKYLQLLMDINVRKASYTFESIEKITKDGK